jgi:DIS3-like exonuclease 2
MLPVECILVPFGLKHTSSNVLLRSLCYCVGKSGDLEAETIALLLEHEVDYSPFSSEVLDNLPQLPWSIPEEEMEKRRDFRFDDL